MFYRKFQDLELSALGLGCMRLPCIDGKEENPDMAATQEMVDYAMANGINYYDTAWGYHYGKSETVIGEALSNMTGAAFILRPNSPATIIQTLQSTRRSSKNSLRSAESIISISISSITSLKAT